MGSLSTAVISVLACMQCGADWNGRAVGLMAVYLAGLAAAEPTRLLVTETADASETGSVEIRGVEAGAFDPGLWSDNRLNWVPDARSPMIAPREGAWRNIYAPSAVETSGGWRLFYGGWDGVSTGKDRIYSTTTTDFLTFGPARTEIEHGSFQHVCNVNALALEGRGFEMVCTVYPDASGYNKPALFRSPDGENWNGSSGIHEAGPTDIVSMTGYEKYPDADINGMNVLLREGDDLRLYFGSFRDFGKVYRATSTDGTTFTLDGIALEERLAVNDVKKFRSSDGDWYLMGLHMNRGSLRYGLSRDGLRFESSKKLFDSLDDSDRYMVAVGWVVQGVQEKEGRKLLGVLYGAGALPSLDANRIFARWLQKRVVLVTEDGRKLEGKRALGPDRQLVRTEGEIGERQVRVRLFAEDGITLLGESEPVTLKAGRAYEIREARN